MQSFTLLTFRQLDAIVTALADLRMLHDGSAEALQEDQIKVQGRE